MLAWRRVLARATWLRTFRYRNILWNHLFLICSTNGLKSRDACRVEPWPRRDPQSHADALQSQGARGRGRMAGPGRGARRRSCAANDRHHRTSQVDPDAQQFARTLGSIARSTPIAAASMAASIALPGRPTPIHDLSPGIDFECRLFVKPDAAQLLHAALSRPGYECGPIAMGTNTDPYQPIEERWRITRSVVELLLETRHPFTITTKSDRVLRDLDLLKPAADLGIASVAHFRDVARSEDRPHARAARARSRGSDWPQSRRSTTPASPASSPSPPSFRRSPTMSLSISSRRQSTQERRAVSIFRCVFRTRSRRSSGPGSTSIIPTARPRSWRLSTPCAADATTIPISSAGCAARVRGPTCSGPASRSPAKNYGLRQAKFPLRRDLFEPPEGDQMRLF